MEWTWAIPNLDPYVNYIFKQLTNWIGDNAISILVLTNLFVWLQKEAARMEEIKDNKVASLCGFYLRMISSFMLCLLSFKWLRKVKQEDNQK